MDFSAAIMQRHSVRKFDLRPIPQKISDTITSCIDQCNQSNYADLGLKLITDEPYAFSKSFMARYGGFSNVRNYIVVKAPDSRIGRIAAGIAGETVVILAQSLGLRTCWVGMSYKSKYVDPSGDGKLYGLIAIGYGINDGKERAIRRPTHFCEGYDNTPDWFKNGIKHVCYAPSALNRQKYKFSLSGNNRVIVKSKPGLYNDIDLGIAIFHFQTGARHSGQTVYLMADANGYKDNIILQVSGK